MNLKALLRRFRVIADDLAEPYLWADSDLVAWANMAERQACRASALLVDSRTASLTEVTAPADEPYIKLDPRVVAVRRAKASGESRPAPLMTVAEMDETRPGWEDATGAVLEALVTDAQTGHLRAYPTQTADLTVSLTVQRLPLKEMTDVEAHSPEIRPEVHEFLVHWMLYQAYSVDDIDKANPEKAAKHLALFEAQFGATTARQEAFQRHAGQNDWQSGYFP